VNSELNFIDYKKRRDTYVLFESKLTDITRIELYHLSFEITVKEKVNFFLYMILF